jgi:hypothetical protein
MAALRYYLVILAAGEKAGQHRPGLRAPAVCVTAPDGPGHGGR